MLGKKASEEQSKPCKVEFWNHPRRVLSRRTFRGLGPWTMRERLPLLQGPPRVMVTCREPRAHFLSPTVPSLGLGAVSGIVSLSHTHKPCTLTLIYTRTALISFPLGGWRELRKVLHVRQNGGCPAP